MAKNKNSASIDDQQAANVTPRREEKTGAGAEATQGMDPETDGASHTHHSAYGGKAGKPKRPNG